MEHFTYEHATLPLEYEGYVENVGEYTRSQRNSTNRYFMVKIRTSLTTSESIKVMDNKNQKRQLFMDKLNSHQGIILNNVGVTEDGCNFFNGNDTYVVDTDRISFKYQENKVVLTVSELKSRTKGTFNIMGTVKWLSESRQQLLRSGRTGTLREGVFLDDSGHMPITVWGQNLIGQIQEGKKVTISDVNVRFFIVRRLETAPGSELLAETELQGEVVWDDIVQEHNRETNTGIEVMKKPSLIKIAVQEYHTCANDSCKKRLEVCPGVKSVKCRFCNYKMPVIRCKRSMHANVTFKTTSTVEVTMFANMLNKYGDLEKITAPEMEDLIIEKDLADISYNKKKIVVGLNFME